MQLGSTQLPARAKVTLIMLRLFRDFAPGPLGLLLAASCALVSGESGTEEDLGLGRLMPPASAGLDEPTGPVCPAQHLAVAVRATAYDSKAFISRYSLALEPCRGFAIDGQSVWSIAGMSDGSDLIGLDGAVWRVIDQDVLWRHEDSSARDAQQIHLVTVEGRSLVAVGWNSYSSQLEELTLLDAETGEVVRSFDPPYDAVALGPSLSGEADQAAILDRYDGLRDYVVDLSAESLGGTDTTEIASPYAGAAAGYDFDDGRIAVAAARGVLYWSGQSPALLGPVTCRWPAREGEPIPETCDGYQSVALARGRADRFYSVCNPHDSELGAAVFVELGYRGDCQLIATAPTTHQITAIAWAGR